MPNFNMNVFSFLITVKISIVYVCALWCLTINFQKKSKIFTGKIFISSLFSYQVTEGATPQQSLEAKSVNSVIKRSLR